MNQYKIVFTDYYYPDNFREIEILKQLGDVEIIDCVKDSAGGLTTEDQVIEKVRNADAVITQFAPFTAKVIKTLDRCRIIARYAIGVDTIDVAAAREKGIVVANVPDYCIEEVSDTAIAHILNCNRKVSAASDYLKTKQWDYDRIKPITRLKDLTIGLIGFGNIARRVAEKLRPFGMEILTFDPYVTAGDQTNWVGFVSFEELLSRSDIISLHAPLNDQTRHLINDKAVAEMKKGVIIVNTSRGGLIDEAALTRGIEKGTIGMVGLDVLDLPDTDYQNSELMKYPERAIITPHMSWYSEQAIAELQAKAALNVVSYFQTGKSLYSV